MFPEHDRHAGIVVAASPQLAGPPGGLLRFSVEIGPQRWGESTRANIIDDRRQEIGAEDSPETGPRHRTVQSPMRNLE
jgi:hypothetical protein